MIDFLKSKTDFDKVEEIVFDKLFINSGLNYLGKHKQKIRKESASEFISYEFKSKKNDLVHINCEKYIFKNYDDYFDITNNTIKALNIKEFREGIYYLVKLSQLKDGSNEGYKELKSFIFRLDPKLETESSNKFLFSEKLNNLINLEIDKLISAL